MAGSDISKNTVAILLVIAVIVSVIGTWTTLTQPKVSVVTESGSSGVAKLQVLGPGEVPGEVSTTGTSGAQLNVVREG